jgi:hypothetical protein
VLWTICYIILNTCISVRRHVFVIVYLRQKTSSDKIVKKTLYWSGPVNILIYWPAVITKTNRENKNVKYNICICIFVFVYLYLYICICIFVFVYLYICICIFVFVYLYLYVCICILVFVYLYITDVAEWSRVLNIRLSDWCCSVSMVWVQIPSRRKQVFAC